MTDKLDLERLSDFVERMLFKSQHEGLTVGELLDEFQQREHMFVCLVFAAPFLLPIPLPGMSTIFGAVILLAAIQMAFGLNPWIPAKWRQRALSAKVLNTTFALLKKILKRLETLIKPRFGLLSTHPWAIRFNGFILIILAILLALPMPPGFNAPPALAIVSLSIGSLEDDGIIIVLGWILSLLNVALFTAFFGFGVWSLARFS